MALENLKKIEEKILGTEKIEETQKTELLTLIGDLKEEIRKLEGDEQQKLSNTTGFMAISALEAASGEKKPEIMEISRKEMLSSVEEFEASHPEIVKIVNSISVMLSNMGI